MYIEDPVKGEHSKHLCLVEAILHDAQAWLCLGLFFKVSSLQL